MNTNTLRAHRALHGFVTIERPITLANVRQAARGMGSPVHAEVTDAEVFSVCSLPGFVRRDKYGPESEAGAKERETKFGLTEFGACETTIFYTRRPNG